MITCSECGKNERDCRCPYGPRGKDWHCAKCGKPMQFKDGLCWVCFGGDPGQ